jgi:hypothetical protein
MTTRSPSDAPPAGHAEFTSVPPSQKATLRPSKSQAEPELRAALLDSREENLRLTSELSSERRSNLRLQQELEERIAKLERELQLLRCQTSGVDPELEPPRHSWVVRKEDRHTADTVRPPPTATKRK